jgi:hypothetical protein
MKAIVRSTVFGVALIAGVVTTATLVDAKPHFHGTYAWTGMRTCTLASQPFDESTLALPAGAFLSRVNSSESGTITFNIDGTGVTEGRASMMTILTAGGAGFTGGAGLSVAVFENRFIFTVNDQDSTIDTNSTGVTAQTVLPTLGGTITGIGLRNRFQIVRGDMLVNAPQTQISHERIFVSPTVTLHRICTPHSFVGTRLP